MPELSYLTVLSIALVVVFGVVLVYLTADLLTRREESNDVAYADPNEDKGFERYAFAAQFTRMPGGSSRDHTPWSGDQFREEFLEPAVRDGCCYHIDLTGTMGFSTAFLDASFGELTYQHGALELYRHFTLQCDDDPGLLDEIVDMIERADAKRLKDVRLGGDKASCAPSPSCSSSSASPSDSSQASLQAR